MRCLFLFACLLFFNAFPGNTQGLDLRFNQNAKKMDIPFEYENNLIIVSVVINNIFPLKFIFDTGAEHTILTKREITDLLQIPYEKRFTIVGSDMQSELYAYLARGLNLKTDNIEFLNRSILVLEDDYFQFEQFTGIDVQGILGADLFRRFIVEINYQKQVISLYDPRYNEGPPGDNFVELPIEMSRHKPYLYACTHPQQDSTLSTKLLLDTGASLALLLYTDTHPDMRLPPTVIKSNIGMGIGGFLEGFLGRVERFDLAGFSFQGVVTNFQEIYPIVDTTYMNDRNGILGNQILSRFVVVIDYVRGRLYLQPRNNYNEQFKFDRSGMVLAASGNRLNTFTVYRVVPGSPADEAGVSEGDVIKSINGMGAGFYSLDDINRKLQGKVGKNIKLKIDRDGETFRTSFRLRELI